MKYEINFKSDIPIYRQLYDMISSDIKSGALKEGTKLQTVRELSDELGLAKGTVKRAYDELHKNGMIEMTQGRGTFVRYSPVTGESRKERAMAAIDEMFRTLKELNISTAEMEIFVGLRLREYLKSGDKVKACFIECSPEILSQISDRLRDIDCLEVFPCLLSDVLEYPYKVSEDTDIIITSATHADALEKALPGDKKILKAALALRSQCVKSIAQLPENAKVGIASKSARFAELMEDNLGKYSRCGMPEENFSFGEGDIGAYLEEKDALLIPANYKNFCSIRERETIERFSARHILVLCTYQTDQGSLLFIEEKINEIKEKKKL